MGIDRVLIGLLICVFWFAFCEASSTSASFVVRAEWKESSVIAEGSEFVAQHASFWSFLDYLKGVGELQTDSDEYVAVETFVKDNVDSRLFPLFRFAMGIRNYAVRVESHRQLGLKVRGDDSNVLFAAVGDDVFFSLEALLDRLSSPVDYRNQQIVHDSDHIICGSAVPTTIVVLYGQIRSSETLEWHDALISRARAKDSQLCYVFRHFIPETREKESIALSGFGVELVVKSTEYLVVDDREKLKSGSLETKEISPEDEIVRGFSFPVVESRYPELREDIRRFRHILETEEEGLVQADIWDLSNAPLLAAQSILASDDPLATLADLSGNFPSRMRSFSKMNVNASLKLELMEADKLLAAEGLPNSFLLLNGRSLEMDHLSPFSFLKEFTKEAMRFEELSKVVPDDAVKRLMEIDVRQLAIPPVNVSRVVWLNDLEKDDMYSDWDKSLRAGLEQTRTTRAPPFVARNAFDLIVVANLGKRDALEIIDQTIMYQRNQAPIRFGYALASFDEASAAIEMAVLTLKDKPHLLSAFLKRILRESETLFRSEEFVRSVYVEIARRGGIAETLPMFTEERILSEEQARRLGMSSESDHIVLMNGRILSLENGLATATSEGLFAAVQRWREVFSAGEASDEVEDLRSFLLEREGAVDVISASLIQLTHDSGEFVEVMNRHELPFLKSPSLSSEFPLETILFPIDVESVDSVESARVLLDALSAPGEELSVRVGFVRAGNPSWRAALLAGVLPRGFEAVKDFFDSLKNENAALAAETDEKSDLLSGRSVCGATCESTSVVVINGRVIRKVPGSPGEWKQLLSVFSKLSSSVAALAGPAGLDSVMWVRGRQISQESEEPVVVAGVQKSPAPWNGGLLHVPSDVRSLVVQGSPWISVTARVNPVSLEGARILPYLETARRLGAHVDLLFSIGESVPARSYYRSSMSYAMEFSPDGALLSSGAAARFGRLPKILFSTTLHAPQAWLCSTAVADDDIDNLRPGDEDIVVEFGLRSFVVEGMAFEGKSRPVASLPVTLDDQRPTVVLGNGYFQLHASPGSHQFSIAKVASLFSPIGPDSAREIVVEDFWTDPMLVVLQRGDPKDTTPIVDAVMDPLISASEPKRSWITGKKSSNDDETVNIFSIASGHLYERFLKIMMLAVRQKTKHPVKFWFIEHFLSPQFKEFVPEYAKEIGVSVELVTYRWPLWLHRQTEKQRLIWAYKILFMDVLFPLDLKRIIFMDADQVARTDMFELWDMDLDGKSMAYTPIGNSNPLVEGFRFWKKGFWLKHLNGKPYHISALFLVDLFKFRKLKGPDEYRSTYDALCKDEGSLANLDQDLPNFLQHQVEIYSLPDEWLWCETWNSQESKARAKTIDLCNNPLTKRPKLDAAKLFIEEWVDLDNKAQSIEENWRRRSASSSSGVAGDVGGPDRFMEATAAAIDV